jgi:integrase
VLGVDIGGLNQVPRAKSSTHVPVVINVSEVRSVLATLDAVPYLVASLLYGAGLRLQECLELRVKDLNFDRRGITVRRGKGQKNRRVSCPTRFANVFRRTWRRCAGRTNGTWLRVSGVLFCPTHSSASSERPEGVMMAVRVSGGTHLP